MPTCEFRFSTRAALERAFSNVMSCEYVEDCQVDSLSLCLRFRASAGPAVRQLFDRIQLDGEVEVSTTASPGRRWSRWWQPPERRGNARRARDPWGFPFG